MRARFWRQWFFRYGFGPDGLVAQAGLFFRNVRQIEYARIENIDIERGVLHRLLGVADVSVQTSTGGKAEARISVLDLEAVQDMRERVFVGDKALAAPTHEEALQPLLRLPVAELVRYGLIDNRGMIIVAAGGGLLYEMGGFSVDREEIMAWLASSSFGDIAALGPAIQAVLALSAIVSALLAVRLLSVALAIVTLFDFTLTPDGRDLRVRYGLLTRVALTLRTSRIQAVHETRSLLHRLFKRASVNVDLTGDRSVAAAEEGKQAKTRWLAPVCREEEAAMLIAVALPTLDVSTEPQWRSLAPGARGRILRRTLVMWTLISTAPAIWWLGWGAPFIVLAGIPLAWMHAHLYVAHTAWALSPDALRFRRGWLTRRLTVAPRNRVQSVRLAESPFDRRSRMASVLVDTAGSGIGLRTIHIRYLDTSVAEALTDDLYRLPSIYRENNGVK